MKDQWNPNQYNKFKDQRSKPFFDLMAMIESGPKTLIDLGCGTGELTRKLHDKLKSKKSLGIDSSQKMLDDAKLFQGQGLEFQQTDIGLFQPTEKFDLVFSNAALQWIPGHERLFPRIFDWVKPGGQIAIQMPYNFDHASHRLAREIAIKKFPQHFSESATQPNVLNLETYSQMLNKNGFGEQSCLIKIYGHPMASGYDVIEWTKGTTLTAFQRNLRPEEFADYLAEYSQELLKEIGTGPYFYPFKRMLLWASRPS